MPERRVALFHRGLGGGGIERVLVNLASGLMRRGRLVDLVLFGVEGPHLARVPAGVNVVLFDTDRTLLATAPLVRYLRDVRPAALLSCTPQTNLIAIAASTLAGGHTRIAVSDHNHISSRRAVATWKDRIAYHLCAAAYPRADRLIAVSEGVAADVGARYGILRDDIEVIYNPVTGPFIDQALASPLEHPWFDEGEPPVFLNMGRLTRQKDQSTLVRAFSRLLRRRAARLMILGEGPLREELDEEIRQLGIESSVALMGYVEEPFPYIARSAAFVLSSRFEGFGNVLAEALACGTPVISTDCPSGPREILGRGAYGSLVPVGDEIAMSEAMEALLEMPRAPERLRRRARDFSIDSVAERYDRVLCG